MKKLILVASPPASGKTYVSEHLAKALGHVVYLDKDDLCDVLHAAFAVSGNKVDMDGEFYVNSLRPAEYSTILNIAFSALRFEELVILNAPFGKEVRDIQAMQALKARTHDLDAELILIWVTAPVNVCYERMKKRNSDRDIRKLENWEEYVKKTNFTPPSELEKSKAVDKLIIFDTKDGESFERSLKEALSTILGE